MWRWPGNLWKAVWLWIDWHGRITTVVVILIAAGGAALVNRAVSVWGEVHGVYLVVISSLAFSMFLGTLVLVGRKLEPRLIDSESLPPNTTERAQGFELRPNLQVDWDGLFMGTIYLAEDGVFLESSLPAAMRPKYFSVRMKVSNPAIPNKKVGTAKQVSAVVEFVHDSGHPSGAGSPSAWLNEKFGSVNVEIHDRKELILAVESGEQWSAVSNIRQADGFPKDSRAMQFREAPWIVGTLKVSVIFNGEARTREFSWDNRAQMVPPQIRPTTPPPSPW
jgi:hypothetical protein